MSSTISRWSARIVEASWLLALTFIPIYFNLYSARHFEPDKAAVLRSLALIGVTAGLIWLIDRQNQRGNELASSPSPWWQTLRATPLFWPVAAYTAVFIVTTITSVTPATSLWGSYQRMQGLYTYLSYIALGVLVAFTLRAVEQRERMISLALAASAVVSIYGIMQHYQLDPLPWRGDVIARVASTLGNSIFVAAYLIMIAPIALYRMLTALTAARSAPTSPQPAAEWRWAIAVAFFWLTGALLILAMLKFSVAVRTIDFRYWWTLPGAIACATALWWLPTAPRGRSLPRWPLALTLIFLLGFGLAFAINATAGIQQFAPADVAVNARDWWVWLGIAGCALLIGYGLAWTTTPPQPPSRLTWQLQAAGSAIVFTLTLITIFFSQSRGPWIGLGAGLFLFVSLTLWYGRKRLQTTGKQREARLLAQALVAWIAITLLSGGFLIVFNLSDAPFFARLREVPYIGRMGRLLEVDSGTGLVRRLIWFGDEYGGGAVGLATSDPLRLLIGWGPESMFVAFNRFYPPALANVEARGASPDRSHQALLDEVVTKGLLGLAAYLWVVGSFAAICLRQLRQTDEWQQQALIIAILSAVTAHLVEGLTGIPIVATLMLFWLLLGLTVAIEQRAQAPARPPEPVAAAKPARQSPTTRRGGAPAARRPASRRSTNGTFGVASLLGLVAAGLIWWLNIQPVYADMRFQQAQSYSEQRNISLRTALQGLNEYLATIRANPGEDFYYLHLARALMTLSDALRAQVGELGEAGTPDLELLLQQRNIDELTTFIQRSTPASLLAYAEAALQRAHQLNPLNKDHYANLGRLNTFWYGASGDVQRLYTALSWYERVAAIAPHDVTLMNERAGVLIQLAEYATTAGDAAQASGYFEQADELLQTSAQLDPLYGDTFLRRGDLVRFRTGDLAAATALYTQAIERAPQQMADNLPRIARALNNQPDLLQQLRQAFATQAERADRELAEATGRPERAFELSQLEARVVAIYTALARLAVQTNDLPGALTAYARIIALQPTNIAAGEQYTLILSETLQHDAALAEARRLQAMLRANNQMSDLTRIEQLIAAIEGARP